MSFSLAVSSRWRTASNVLLCASVVTVTVGCGAAYAADLPSRVAPPVFVPPPVVSTWTGFYAGINAGYSLDHVPTPYNFNRDPRPGGQDFSAYTEKGPLAGGQIGYNMQFRDVPVIGRLPLLSGYSFLDNVVTGVEIDGDWSDINGSRTVSNFAGSASFGTRIKNFATLRGRTGYSFGPLLVYLHSGISYGTVESYYNAFGFSGSRTVSRLPLRPGTYGIGAEYKLSANWSVRAEYMYDYVAVKYVTFNQPNGGSFGFLSRASFHVARAALNYHFDLFNAPVVARY